MLRARDESPRNRTHHTSFATSSPRGDGRILVAEDRRLRRPVALKERGTSLADRALDRRSPEVRVTARLQHPLSSPLEPFAGPTASCSTP